MAKRPNEYTVDMMPEIKRIYTSLKSYYEDHIWWTKWVPWYKNYLLYTVDRQLEIEDFQTNIKVPIVKMYVDAMWTSVYDNNLEFRVSGRTKKDHKKAQSLKDYLEWWFSVSGSRKHFMQSIKEALILWNWYWRIGFVDETTEIEYTKKLKKIKKTQKEQHPYIQYVSAFDIMHDPTVEYMEDSKYVMYRKIMHKKDIIKMYRPFVQNIEWKITDSLKNPWYFFQYDFNRIKFLSFWNQELIQKFVQTTSSSWVISSDFNIFYKNYLTFDFEWGYSEVVEYWEDDKFVLIVNGMQIHEWPNPFPIKKKPFFEIHRDKIPWIAFWQWMALTLKDIQSIADTIFNLTIDNIKMQVAPMFTKVKWWDLFEDGEQTLTYQPFKVVETNMPEALQRMQLGSPDFSGTNMVEYLVQLWEMSEGVNSYAIWYQNKVERSATWVSALVQSFKSRLLPLVESMNMALSKIAEMWAVIWVALLEDELDIRIFDENNAAQFKTITMEDLLGKFDIEFDAQALKTATRETRRKQFMDLLSLASTAWFDPNTQTYFIDMKKIWAEVLDSFEISSSDVVMDDMNIAKKQVSAQDAKEKVFNKYQQKKQSYANNQPGSYFQAPQWPAWPTVNDQYPQNAIEWEQLPEEVPQSEAPMSSILKEAFQS